MLATILKRLQKGTEMQKGVAMNSALSLMSHDFAIQSSLDTYQRLRTPLINILIKDSWTSKEKAINILAYMVLDENTNETTQELLIARGCIPLLVQHALSPSSASPCMLLNLLAKDADCSEKILESNGVQAFSKNLDSKDINVSTTACSGLSRVLQHAWIPDIAAENEVPLEKFESLLEYSSTEHQQRAISGCIICLCQDEFYLVALGSNKNILSHLVKIVHSVSAASSASAEALEALADDLQNAQNIIHFGALEALQTAIGHTSSIEDEMIFHRVFMLFDGIDSDDFYSGFVDGLDAAPATSVDVAKEVRSAAIAEVRPADKSSTNQLSVIRSGEAEPREEDGKSSSLPDSSLPDSSLEDLSLQDSSLQDVPRSDGPRKSKKQRDYEREKKKLKKLTQKLTTLSGAELLRSLDKADEFVAGSRGGLCAAMADARRRAINEARAEERERAQSKIEHRQESSRGGNAPPPNEVPLGPEETAVVASEHGVEAPATSTCVVCFEGVRNMVFIPCGHKVCCADCSKAVMDSTQECPVCRARCDNIFTVYE